MHWESLQSYMEVILINCGMHKVHFMGYAPSMLPNVMVQVGIH